MDRIINLCKKGDGESIEEIKQIINDTKILTTIINIYTIVCNIGILDIMKYILDMNIIEIHKKREKVFISTCIRGYTHIVKYLLEYYNDNYRTDKISNYVIYKGLIYSSERGNLNTVKYIIEYCRYTNINIHNNNEELFRNTCKFNRTEVVKYLVDYCNIHNTPIDIHVCGEQVFLISCYCKFDIMIFLLEYSYKMNDKINIHINNEKALRNCINSDVLDAVKYLLEFSEKTNDLFDVSLLDVEILFTNRAEIRIQIFEYLNNYCKKHNMYINIYITDTNRINNNYFIDYIHAVRYIVKQSKIYDYRINLNITDMNIFVNMCLRNEIDIVKYIIWQNEKKNNKCDIQYDNVYILIGACNEHIIKYIVYLSRHNYIQYDFNTLCKKIKKDKKILYNLKHLFDNIIIKKSCCILLNTITETYIVNNNFTCGTTYIGLNNSNYIFTICTK